MGGRRIATTPTSAYSAAQAGRHVLTKNLAIELAADGIRVNTVALAFVETPAYERFMTPEEAQAVLDSVDGFHPLGRRGQPSDVAEAIVFLAGDGARWITGTTLPIDAEALRAAARACAAIVTVEDHWPEGGLGDAVLEALADADERPRVKKLAVREMPMSGAPAELLREAGIDAEAIAAAARAAARARA